MRARRFSIDSRTLWIAAGLLLGFGYLVVATHYERAIRISIDHSKLLFEQTAANEKVIDDATRLRAAQGQVQSDLGRFGTARASGQMAGLLKLLDASAKDCRVRIVRVMPQAQPPPSPLTAIRGAQSEKLVGQPVDIGLRGKFRDILRLLGVLSERDVLIRIDSTKLTIENIPEGPNQAPELNATIHATLYNINNHYRLKAGLDETN